jgi:putative endonuclease
MTLFRKSLGQKGERAAERFLRKAGCRILARNFKAAGGEIDLVAQEKASGRIVFAEVKTRSDESVASGEQAVGRRKQQHIVRAARAFLKAKRIADDMPMRFDVLAVTFDAEGRPVVRHTPAAFRP